VLIIEQAVNRSHGIEYRWIRRSKTLSRHGRFESGAAVLQAPETVRPQDQSRCIRWSERGRKRQRIESSAPIPLVHVRERLLVRGGIRVRVHREQRGG